MPSDLGSQLPLTFCLAHEAVTDPSLVLIFVGSYLDLCSVLWLKQSHKVDLRKAVLFIQLWSALISMLPVETGLYNDKVASCF